MPVVVMSKGGGHSILSSASVGPKSHLCISVFTLLINPIFGSIAVGFAIASQLKASTDWDGARMRGQIAMIFSVIGIVTSGIAGLIAILILFSRDS